MEEVFHGSGGLKEDEHLGGAFADLGEGVWGPAWSEGAVAGFEVEGIVAYFYDKLAGDNIEPFVLVVVEVQGRAAFLFAAGIVDEEFAVGIF